MTPLRQRMLEDLQIRHYAPTTIPHLPACHRRVRSALLQATRSARCRAHSQLSAVPHQREASVAAHLYPNCLGTTVFLYPHTQPKNRDRAHSISSTGRKLPRILSREEVKALLEAPRNLRQRTLLAVLYGSGLRVAEVTQLKASDIDSVRNVLWVRRGKGRKDRQTLLPTKLLELLRCYWRTRRPTGWLFLGADPSRAHLSQSHVPGLPESGAKGWPF